MPNGISLSYPFAGNPPLTQGYGNTGYGKESAAHGYAHWHEGFDYGMACGAPVLAAGPGSVLSNGTQDGTHDYGPYHVIIDHGPDTTGVSVYSLYGHLESNSVQPGQEVARGEQIGKVGALGNASACHLHFTVYHPLYKDEDPAIWLTGSAPRGGYSTPPPGVLTPEQAVYYARAAGIPEDQLATCVAIAMAESRLKADAIGYNRNRAGRVVSIDRGLWQINSSHGYDATRLFDPAYNAEAMAEIYKQRLAATGQRWTDWTTYNTGAYLTYYKQAQEAVAAVTPGTLPPGLAPDGPGGQPDTGSLLVPSIPADTSPQQPVTRYRLVATTTNPGLLAPPADLALVMPVCALWIAGHWLPVRQASVTATQYLTPGSFSATVSIPDTVDRIGEDGLETILSSGRTQVVVVMGYVPSFTRTLVPTTLVQMITGLVDDPEPQYSGPDESITFSGPDLSGIFSDESATSSTIKSSWLNLRSDQLVSELVLAHNPRGHAGLSVSAARGEGKVGALLGEGITQTRTTGQTEWDLITMLAVKEGFVAFMQGSDLYFGPPPPEAPPLVLGYRVDGQPAGPVVTVTPKIAPHNKRSYKVVASSWNSKTQTALTSTQGNHDATLQAQISLQANLPQKEVTKAAKAAARLYAASERTLGLDLVHPVPLVTGQPVILRSDRPGLRQFRDQKFYPTAQTYDFAAQPPALTMHIDETCLPPAQQSDVPTSSSAVSLGDLGGLGDLGLDTTPSLP